ncbi:DUF724 domain-containing protein 3-like isoform X1 [Aristolochia californica]|uniref:DUF724 domain-containing protein 3-like isoform X1 n=1 Tax=Aristolochia californica TaxID=171875 RepID=UPI0035DD72D0
MLGRLDHPEKSCKGETVTGMKAADRESDHNSKIQASILEGQGGTKQMGRHSRKRGRPRKMKPEELEVLEGTKERREPWIRGETRRKIKALKKGGKHKALGKMINEVIVGQDISISDAVNKVPGDLPGVAEPRISDRLLGRDLGMVQSDVNSLKPQLNMNLFGSKCNGIKAQINTGLQTSMITFLDNPSCNEQSPNKTQLSFVKTSSLWELLGSMEVFKRMPQKPHFHPLEQYTKDCREGMAIAHMVNFVNLVSGVHDARFDDTVSLKNKLELLQELEQHGFCVQPLQARIEALLRLKERHGVFESELNKIETEVREQEHEWDDLDIEIIKLDMDMAVLKESLALLREKRALIISQSEIGKTDILKWQKEIQVIKEDSFDAKREFEAIVATC